MDRLTSCADVSATHNGTRVTWREKSQPMSHRCRGLRWTYVPLVLLTLLAACAPAQPAGMVSQASTTVSFVGYAPGSSTQLRANALAEAVRLAHPDWNVSSMASGGEARLIASRIAREADFFYTQSTRVLELAVQQPLHPDIDFAEATAYRLIMPSARLYVYFFAQDDAPVVVPRDIIESRYPYRAGVGSGVSRLLLSRVFEHYGSSLEEAEAWGASHETIVIASAEGAEALQSGRIDIGFTWTSVPNAQFAALALDVKLLPIDDPGLVGMFEELGCVPAVIPEGSYSFVTADVPTVAAPQYLAVRADVPDDIVYQVVKAVYDRSDILFAAHAESRLQFSAEGIRAALVTAQRNGESFHPGALEFYRDMGWVD